jgi:predicted RNA-binding protein with PIN domain
MIPSASKVTFTPRLRDSGLFHDASFLKRLTEWLGRWWHRRPACAFVQARRLHHHSVRACKPPSPLPMPLLIDTMNVLHVTGVLPPDLAGLDGADLARMIRLSRYRDQHVTLVCDGRPQPTKVDAPADNHKQIAILFSGSGRTADEVIERMIKRSTSPRRLTVVSSDHAVLRAARRRRCPVLSSEAFLKQLVTDVQAGHRTKRASAARRPAASSMTAEQVARWERLFDVDMSALSRAVEHDPRLAPERDEPAAAAGSGKATPANRVKPRTLRLSDQARAKRGSTNRKAQTSDREPPKPVLPRNLVDEAERLAAEYESTRRFARRKPDPR